MQRFNIVSFANKRLRYCLSIDLGPRKDNPIQTRVEINDSLQRFVAINMRRDEILVINISSAGIHFSDGNFKWLLHVSLAYLPDLCGHGGANQPGALSVWRVF